MNFWKTSLSFVLAGLVVSNLSQITYSQAADLGYGFHPTEIASTLESGGFVVGGPIHRGIRIMSDGTVQSYDHDQHRIIARLSYARVAFLRKSIDSLNAASLQNQDPNAPFCADIPTITYQVNQSAGATLEIARDEGCHNFNLSSGQGRNLEKILRWAPTISFAAVDRYSGWGTFDTGCALSIFESAAKYFLSQSRENG